MINLASAATRPKRPAGGDRARCHGTVAGSFQPVSPVTETRLT
jgi:hypothetical protein